MSIEEQILKVRDSQVGWFDGYELRKIAEDVCKMENRIKRLEEAGDKMERWCSDAVSADNWRKAKEAKL